MGGDAGMARDSWTCSSLVPPLIAGFANIRPCVRSAAASWDLALGEHRERDADKHKEQQEGDGEHNLPPLIAPVARETGVERDDRLLPSSNLDNRREQVPDRPVRRIPNHNVLTADLAGDPLEIRTHIPEIGASAPKLKLQPAPVPFISHKLGPGDLTSHDRESGAFRSS